MVKRSRSRSLDRSTGRRKNSRSQSSQDSPSSVDDMKNDLEIDCLERYISDSKTLKTLEAKGIKKFFPVQYTTFKIVKKGKDLIAKDRTGSGKTLAYSLPVIERLREQGDFDNPRYTRFLVICPTRELSIQVRNEFMSLRHSAQDYKVVNVYGGTHIGEQLNELRAGANVIVGTPGRLIDMMGREAINLTRLSTLCIDEADEMLKMGFQEDIEKIFGFIKKDAR